MSALPPGETGAAVRVSLVLVSHSRALADGAAELARQMAPDVLIIPAGGNAGGLGTSFDLISEAIDRAAADDRSVVVLTDLGSAVLTTESVLEFADDDLASRVRLADAPFVEGAVAAAVSANGGADLAGVLAVAVHAGSTFRGDSPGPVVTEAADGRPAQGDGALICSVVLRNPLGLHARPAALLARLVAGFDATVTVNGVNAASVLELMQLGVTGGQQLEVSASGPEAEAAAAAVVGAVEGGFDEV